MKPALCIFLLACWLSSFSQSKADSIEMVNLLVSDYATMGTWNADEHAQNCTSDYLLIENGEIWDLPKELEYYHAKSGTKTVRKDKFTFKHVKSEANTGYAVYDLQTDIIEKGVLKTYHWNESVIFRRLNRQWKIALIHSTPIIHDQKEMLVPANDSPRVTGIGGIFLDQRIPKRPRNGTDKIWDWQSVPMVRHLNLEMQIGQMK
jgi:hypothetical protein